MTLSTCNRLWVITIMRSFLKKANLILAHCQACIKVLFEMDNGSYNVESALSPMMSGKSNQGHHDGFTLVTVPLLLHTGLLSMKSCMAIRLFSSSILVTHTMGE